MTDVILSDDPRVAEIDKVENDHPSIEELQMAELGARATMDIGALTLHDRGMPIESPANRHFHAQRTSGTRPLSQVVLEVIHCTQGGTALAAAAWFQNPAARGSAHTVSDNNIRYRCLRDEQIPWGAPGANYHGRHHEQAGFVTWSQAMWSKKHRNTIRRCAYSIALGRVATERYTGRKALIRWLGPKQLRAGQLNGITDHMSCTLAYGGDHTDPGRPYPRALLLAYTRYYYARIKRQQRRRHG